ncbi:metal ABC transporter ATP-binding protein [Nisaea acidiphila]|uniref:Metal ABC transporter ATP-binding protein n=1 Tax=Nisaea acidiphila TaxID=1862145 RepID=A0A9J7AWD4_9PROT|nr:metal ABC transporter ATP-binding protein [Nisaea acidiphila]UUX49749.1 metal ABC transporter ATP-binding protein [Nisaea acidiphila]
MLDKAPSLLDVSHLTVERNGRKLLDDISFSLGAGEIISVIGPNGGGKTTLLRTVLGLIVPDGGSVKLAPGTSIGYVPQKLAIDATMPLTPQRFLSLGMKGVRGRVADVAERCGISHLLDRQLAALSGGETQRVLLARAILKQPSLLVLDEPTQGMDVAAQSDLFRLVEAIREETGAAVILVSHDLHLVMRGTDRVLCLNGHLCCTGHPAEVERDPSFRSLFGRLDEAAVVPYRHDHDHTHDGACDHDHGHDHGHHHHH